MLTFVWTKEKSTNTTYIDWNLKIIGMNDKLTDKIQTQVNSVSSLADDSQLKQSQIDEEAAERQMEHMLHGSEIFRGGSSVKKPSAVLPQPSE